MDSMLMGLPALLPLSGVGNAVSDGIVGKPAITGTVGIAVGTVKALREGIDGILPIEEILGIDGIDPVPMFANEGIIGIIGAFCC